MSAASASRAKRLPAQLLALGMPLLAVFELAAHFGFAARAPDFASYEQLKDPVAQMRGADEPVVAAPDWASPLLRGALGDELMPIAQQARPDMSGYPVAIEVSLMGQRSPALVGWREVARRRQGAFLIRQLANPDPRPVLFDFVAALHPDHAEVTLAGAHCPWREDAPVLAGGLGGHPTFPARGFDCPGGRFFHAAATVIADQDFRPRRCIWAHPPAQGELSLRFRDVPLGKELVGHGGIYWMVERERRGAPVDLSIAVDGDEVGRVTHRDGEGWAPFELPLGQHAGRRADVELAVRSADYRQRHFCFEVRSR